MAFKINDYSFTGGAHGPLKLGGTTVSGSYHVIEGINWATGSSGVFLSPRTGKLTGEGNTLITIAVYENSGAYARGSSSFETLEHKIYLNFSSSISSSMLSSSYEALRTQATSGGTYTASIHTVLGDPQNIGKKAG